MTHDHTTSPAYQDAALVALDLVKVAATDPDGLLGHAMAQMDLLQHTRGATAGPHFLIAILAEFAAAAVSQQFRADPNDCESELDLDALADWLDKKYMIRLGVQARNGGLDRWLDEQ